MKRAKIILPLLVLLVGMVIGYAARRGSRNKSQDEAFLLILGVVPGSVSDELGVLENDILHSYNGNLVQSIEELEAAKELAVDSAEVLILRTVEGEVQTISLMFPVGQMGLYLEPRLPELEYAKDTVIIQGIGPLRPDEGTNNSFAYALSLVGRHLRDTLDYTMLMGLSGAAFRTQMHYQWDRLAIEASEGYRCDLTALQAMGYEYRYLKVDENLRNVEDVRDTIKLSIDAGSPVLAFQLVSSPRWGIITGYQKGGRELIIRSYDDKRTGYSLAESFPSQVCLIEGRRDIPPSLREAKIRSFAIAQEILETEDRVDSYYIGRRGLRHWQQVLETGKFYGLNPDDFERIMIANVWMYMQLVEDRTFAASYLRRIAPEFPDVQAKLRGIADLYESEANYLTVPLEEGGIIVFPDELESQYDWTPEMRIAEINYLRFAILKEDEALKLWREVNAIYNPHLFEEAEEPIEEVAPEPEPEPEPTEEIVPEPEPETPTRFHGKVQ